MPRICVIQLNVHDMDAALGFYCEKLGFGIRDRALYPEIVQLEHSDIPFILHQVGRPTAVDYPNESQTLINVEVDDLVQVIHDLREQGVNLIHEQPQGFPLGVYAALRDPSGNALELVEFRAQLN